MRGGLYPGQAAMAHTTRDCPRRMSPAAKTFSTLVVNLPSTVRVIIIGTGDTASDCVATALRQGCRSVTQLVRRPREDYLKNGVLPLDYAHEEAIAAFGQDPRQIPEETPSVSTPSGRGRSAPQQRITAS